MQQNIEFERCIDFLVRMIDKYGDEVLRELEASHGIGSFLKYAKIQNQTAAFYVFYKNKSFQMNFKS